jgi:phosphoglycolate phosphatase
LGWSRYFARLVGATDAIADKPDPAPIHLALEGSGIAAGPEVWYVGDTAVDIECALNAGCVPVLLGPAKPDDVEFSVHRPRVAFDDCSRLFLHIRTL